MYLDLGRWINRISIVLEWTPEEAERLTYSRIDLLWQSAAASVYISREHGRILRSNPFMSHLQLLYGMFLCAKARPRKFPVSHPRAH